MVSIHCRKLKHVMIFGSGYIKKPLLNKKTINSDRINNIYYNEMTIYNYI
jgi:hypothetical protein